MRSRAAPGTSGSSENGGGIEVGLRIADDHVAVSGWADRAQITEDLPTPGSDADVYTGAGRPDCMDAQARVATFVDEHDLDAPAAYRLLDTVSELGEVATEVCTSTEYGDDPSAVDVSDDELGDALFALLALCEALGVDAEAALEASLAKYEERLVASGGAGSGE